jgi:hypothetical protein
VAAIAPATAKAGTPSWADLENRGTTKLIVNLPIL